MNYYGYFVRFIIKLIQINIKLKIKYNNLKGLYYYIIP